MSFMRNFLLWMHAGADPAGEVHELARRLAEVERERDVQFASMQAARYDMDRCSLSRSDPPLPPSLFDQLEDEVDAADDLMRKALGGEES